MKYKVGDKVRMGGGDVITIERFVDTYAFHNMFVCVENNLMYFNSGISHLVISEITDELIDRFKKEKTAWHFKSKEDYMNTLDILESKSIKFTYLKIDDLNYIFSREEEFCIVFSLYNNRLGYCNKKYFKENGYEIIEIMNPVYVPKKLVIDQVNGDIKVHGYSLKIINDIFYADGLRLEYQDGKLCYKGIDCEVLFQGYQTKQLFEKKFKEQQDDINTLHYRLDCAKYERERYLKENNDLKQMIKNQQFVIQSHREKLGTIRDVLDED